jgi:predicted metallopeptidase
MLQACRTGFDFTTRMRVVCEDMVARLPEFGHVDLTRVAISFAQARKQGPFGLCASLTPMRFAGGARIERRRGRYYQSQVLCDAQGREMLYILSFCLPRFMDLAFREKLATILHELWHIGPTFDGDIRRHVGRCYAHSPSQQRYDAAMLRLADRWLTLGPEPAIYAFLHGRFDDLRQQYGRIYGLKVARPKLLPITAEEAHRNQTRDVPTH